MSAPLDAPPWTATVIDKARILSGDWTRWLQAFWIRVKTAVQLVGTPILTTTPRSAAIATTTIYTVTQNGQYRVTVSLWVTTADGVSSSLALTLTWRVGGVTFTKTFPAVTGDTVTTFDSQTWPVVADSGTLIRYAVAYASNTAAKMRYRDAVTVEQVS